MVLGAVGAGEPAKIIGFSLGQEGGGQDRRWFAGLQTIAGDPFLADARLLHEHDAGLFVVPRSEEHTSELQSLMRISYAVFCLKKKNNKKQYTHYINNNYTKHTIQRSQY